VFTAEQAAAGRQSHQKECASCHAGDLGGRDDAPALTGDAFMATWGTRTTKELFEFVGTTMPPEGSSMTPDDYLGVVAHMLQQNGATAGTRPLTATTAVTINAVATGKKPASAFDSPMLARHDNRRPDAER
jgi:mono/diheme cytochrome c family protein